jgi:MraZ protein
VEANPRPAPVEPPRGTYQARVDEKGRLKLPAVFQQYLTDLGETKVFVTSLDVRIARIYPISVWKENEILF